MPVKYQGEARGQRVPQRPGVPEPPDRHPGAEPWRSGAGGGCALNSAQEQEGTKAASTPLLS